MRSSLASFSRASASAPPTPSSSGGAAMQSFASASASSSLGLGLKRSSVFTPPPTSAFSTQSLLQKLIFAKQHEEIFSMLQVYPRQKPQAAGLDVLASFGVAAAAEADQAYFLVLTRHAQIQKSSDGFGAPKLHWVKIKAPESAGGDLQYNYKKFKLLKLLKRIEMSGSNGTTNGSGLGSASSGTLRREKEEFTLVFRSGDQDKAYSFVIKGAESAMSDRSVFIWYCLEICRSYCGFVPTSNIDTVLYQQLTHEITAFYLSEPPPTNITPQLRALMQSVSKNRVATAEQDSKQLSRSKIEEKVVLPSMTAEETGLVQHFLRQIETQSKERRGSKSAAEPASVESCHSHINELESYLLHRLSVLDQQNIASLFDPTLESTNKRILESDIQSNLLDSKLEEMSLWINHHNAELTKMKKGIELIEKRNMKLDIAEKNHSALHDALKTVLDSLRLHPDPAEARRIEELLEHPDFSPAKLDYTLAAVQQLDQVLQMSVADGKLEELRAIKEQREKYEAIRVRFTRQAETALDHIFVDEARRAIAEVHKRESVESSTLSTNASLHRDLRRYLDLVRFLERLAGSSFLALRPNYSTAVRPLYEAKTKLYFASLRRALAQEGKDSRMASFPDWNIDVARAVVRRTEGGRNVSTSSNASVAALLKTGPNVPLPPSQTGRLLATQAFVQALANLAPVCLSEEKFLKEFFGVKAANAAASAAAPAAAAPALKDASANGGSSGSLAVSKKRPDGEEIRVMMTELFRGLEAEMRELSTQATKMDHFYTLEMLCTCERMMAEGSSNSGSASPAAAAASAASASASSVSKCEFLESIVTSVSLHLKLSFTAYIDGEIAWMNGQSPNPKRCGILAPFLKFPALVDRMENVVWSAGAEGAKTGSGSAVSRSQAADTSYQKLASALFRWLDTIARSDEKYTDVVYIENAHFFHSLFTAPALSIPALDQFVQKSHDKYLEHMRLYVAWNVDYEMPAISKFWARLEEQLKTLQAEDIPFASDLSKHDLRALCKGPLSSKPLQKSLSNVLKRVEKHMPKNPTMIQSVWAQLAQTFLAKLSRFELIVQQCYQNEKIGITQQEVADMFQQLLPTNAPYKPQQGAGTPSHSQAR